MDSEREKENDPGVTMLDVLQDEQELEQDANAVLGAADDKNCTYDQGYMKRQAVYACNTCSVPRSPDFVPAGMCLACSYHCHGNHELVELYTKRNFRCDCGTDRLPGVCSLRPGKANNTDNKYNQNYRGVYCICSRPYPDPEDTVPDQMIQCVVCEDWFHGRHLSLPKGGPPSDQDYAEMICVSCVQRCRILLQYTHFDVTKAKPNTDEISDGISPTDLPAAPLLTTNETAEPSSANDSVSFKGDGSTNNSAANKTDRANEEPAQSNVKDNPVCEADKDVCEAKSQHAKDPEVTKSEASHLKDDQSTETAPCECLKIAQADSAGGHKISVGKEGDSQKAGNPGPSSVDCKLKKKQKAVAATSPTTLFLPKEWRAALCRCPACSDHYTDLGISFLVDPTDTVHHYEAQADTEQKGQFEQGMEELSKMDRVKQVEAIAGYNSMKTELMDFLAGFARDNRVVKQEDINQFFQRMGEAKRRRLE